MKRAFGNQHFNALTSNVIFYSAQAMDLSIAIDNMSHGFPTTYFYDYNS